MEEQIENDGNGDEHHGMTLESKGSALILRSASMPARMDKMIQCALDKT
jgi:hypothetical protein